MISPYQKPEDESPARAVETLLSLLADKEYKKLSQLLRWDFATKLLDPRNERLFGSNKSQYVLKFLEIIQPELIHASMIKSTPKQTSEKEIAEVAFIAIIKPELDALKVALNIPLDKPEDYSKKGIRFWKTKIKVANQLEPIDAIVTMVGDSRNVECAVAMGTIFRRNRIGLCILVGIAAGLETKTKIGDVVVANDMVLDYEGQRLEPTGSKKRPKAYPLDNLIKRDLSHFDPARAGWHKYFHEMLPKLHTNDAELAKECEAWRPSYVQGVILSGEKLLVDGRLPQMQEEYSEKVRAGEMEGSGFARSCVEEGVPWLIFRGVSDYGQIPKPDKYQSSAALAAAVCALTFVQNDYRIRTKPDSEDF